MVLSRVIRLLMGVCLFVAAAGVAYAKENSACNEDYEKFCKGLFPGGSRVLECLIKNADELKPQCRALLSQLIVYGGKKVSMTLMPSLKDEKPAPVPGEYRKLYTAVDEDLGDFDRRLDAAAKGEGKAVVFGAGLPSADSVRGRALLKSGVIEDVIGYLDQLKDIGVQGVTVSIGYPLYTPGFPGYGEYVSFYKEVAREVKKRDMKLCVEAGVVFANTSYSDVRASHASLTFERYKAEKKQMASAIIRDMDPDYLDVGSEPDTEAMLTGLSELNDPLRYAEYVRYVIDGLGRGKARIAAGMGSWANVAFATSLARFTGIDVLAIHVYPVAGRAPENALAMADIARQHGKGVIVDEAWLAKSDRYVSRGGEAWAELYRRNNFSFFAPLDRKFLGIMAKFARAKGVEYISPSRSDYFFAYVDYDEKSADLPYRDIQSIAERAAGTGVREGKLTSTGRHYWVLIGDSPK